jgi:hypothetical protein
MKVLQHGSRKTNPVLYDISTPEKEAAAYLLLFTTLNEDLQCYVDLEDGSNLCEPCTDGQHKYCRGGCNGDEECSCDSTPDCKNHNHRALAVKLKNQVQRGWYEKALNGDWKAAKMLLTARNDYEYEEIEVLEVTDPLEKEA